MTTFPRSAALAAALLLALGPARADPVAAFDPGGGLAGGSNGYILSGTVYNYTLGFQFTATQNLRVTELGMFDFNGSGPGTDRQVGLFQRVAGSWVLRVSTHFLAAEQATHHIGGFSYHDIADFDLVSGGSYAMLASGYYGGAQSPLFNRSTTSLAGISYGSGLYNVTHSTSDAFAGPNFSTYDLSPQYYTYMGANFLWNSPSAAAPEPGTLLLAGLALGLLGRAGRRRG